MEDEICLHERGVFAQESKIFCLAKTSKKIPVVKDGA
jgi:hypothetical protein